MSRRKRNEKILPTFRSLFSSHGVIPGRIYIAVGATNEKEGTVSSGYLAGLLIPLSSFTLNIYKLLSNKLDV